MQEPQEEGPPTTGSISAFTKDEDFVEFLKKIELYATDDQSPKSSNLFNNLKFIRDKFQEFKQQAPL